MSSHRTATAALAFGLALAAWGSSTPAQQDHASAQEVVRRVQQAAEDIAKSGETALATFSSKNDTSVWQDSYIFILSCTGGTAVVAAHPVRPELTGEPLAKVFAFGPAPGEQVAAATCAAGSEPRGGWVEYDFPKPGGTQPERKVSYLMAAQGTPYVVGAGIYDPTTNVEVLDKLNGG